MITLCAFEKKAFPLYDYTACASRNFVPKSPKMPREVREGDIGKKVKIPKNEKATPKWKQNEPSNAQTTTYPYYHSFEPTVSGTGGGAPLWTQPHDPYAN